MKPIYIYKPHTKSNKTIIGILILVLVLVALGMMAPVFIKSYINKAGADEKGYAFRIGDLDINPLKSQMRIYDLKVFNVKSAVTFADMSDIKVNFNLIDLLKNEKRMKLTIDELNFIISKDLFEEVNRVKNEAKEKMRSDFYVDEIVARAGKINIRDLRNDNTRTVLSLENANLTLHDFGFGSINEKTEFKIDAAIAEGGKMNLNGKTRLEAEHTPWTINGEMTGINSKVIEKMAGDKLPLEIKETKINTKITASSSGGQIVGHLSPDVKEFRIVDPKEDNFLKRNIAKASNFILNKTTEGDKEVKLEIPFSLNQNFTINIEETLKKLRAD